MKIIVLLGCTNSGKTTTINMVFSIIGGKAAYNKIQYGSPNDFESNFVYKNKNIAIYSLGDTQARVCEAIDKYTDMSVDVLIVAYNTRFAKSLSTLKPNNTFVTINKTFDRQNQDTANKNDCNNIILNI